MYIFFTHAVLRLPCVSDDPYPRSSGGEAAQVVRVQRATHPGTGHGLAGGVAGLCLP